MSDPFDQDFTDEPVHIDITAAMVLGGFTALCACLPGGIAAIWLARSAATTGMQGNEEGARQKLMYSYVVSGISLLFGLPLSVLYLMNM